MTRSIKFKTQIIQDVNVEMTADEVLDSLSGDYSGIIEALEERGFEVKNKDFTNDNDKVIHAICDRFGLSYHTDKNTILELFRSEILRA